jgi:transcriptional regulator with XRE-family HTH domain
VANPRRDPDGDRLLEAFARNLRGARHAAGLSQEALANQSGVAQSMISRIEAGGQEPGIRTAAYLARGLGVELTELLRGVR